MPPPDQLAPPPGWILGLRVDLDRLAASGTPADPAARAALEIFAVVLEIDDLPAPRLCVINRHLIRATWSTGRETLGLDCRAGWFQLRATDPGHELSSTFDHLRWVDAARRAFRWICPRCGSGYHPDAVRKEAEN